MKAEKRLIQLAKLKKDKGKEYGDSYKRHGAVMAGLFPHGICLETADDFNRFAVYDLMVVKMVRYSVAFENNRTSPDSLDDLSVYAAILQELDSEKEGE